MPLLNEGTTVWRPVEVTPLEGAIYRVEGPMPADEDWQYGVNAMIELEWKKFEDGEHQLVPAGHAPTVTSIFVDHYKRMGGLLAGLLPFFALMQWLPRNFEGRFDPTALALAGTVLAASSVSGLIWPKPRSLTARWTLGVMLMTGAIICVGAIF